MKVNSSARTILLFLCLSLINLNNVFCNEKDSYETSESNFIEYDQNSCSIAPTNEDFESFSDLIFQMNHVMSDNEKLNDNEKQKKLDEFIKKHELNVLHSIKVLNPYLQKSRSAFENLIDLASRDQKIRVAIYNYNNATQETYRLSFGLFSTQAFLKSRDLQVQYLKDLIDAINLSEGLKNENEKVFLVKLFYQIIIDLKDENISQLMRKIQKKEFMAQVVFDMGMGLANAAQLAIYYLYFFPAIASMSLFKAISPYLKSLNISLIASFLSNKIYNTTISYRDQHRQVKEFERLGNQCDLIILEQWLWRINSHKKRIDKKIKKWVNQDGSIENEYFINQQLFMRSRLKKRKDAVKELLIKKRSFQ